MRVPFVDLTHTNSFVRAAVLEDVERMIDDGAFVGGPTVSMFEDAFAAATGQGTCVGVSSGLDALRIALLSIMPAGGWGGGGWAGGRRKVIVPAMTFVATWEAVVQAGYDPLPVDVLPDGSIDPAAVAEALASSPDVRAVVPVHLYGQMADMVALDAVARRADHVHLIEDAAQALGAMREGVRPGELSTAAAHSFYPTKNLGAFGDAGAITTASGWLDSAARRYREHGIDRTGHHHQVGYTARLDALQAAVLGHKLRYLGHMLEARRDAAALYFELLDCVGDLRLPQPAVDSEPGWHLFPVRTSTPDLLGEHLANRGVGTGRHYRQAVHRTCAFRGPWPAGGFLEAERVAAETLSLPLWPGITEAQQEHVAASVRAWFDGDTEVPR